MQQTYNLFVEVLCNRQVPVVITVTHLEMLDDMEQWWRENEDGIKEYGLRSIGHACITTTRGYKGIFSDKYEQSKQTIRKLLLELSGEVSWKEEKASWVKRHMRSWLPPPRRNHLDENDLKKKLVKRCGFSIEDADLVARRIEQLRRASEDASGEEQSWFDGKLANGGKHDVKKSVEPSNVKAALGVIPGKDIAKSNVTEDAPVHESRNVRAAFGVVSGKEATKKSVAGSTLLEEPRNVKAALDVVPKTTKNVANGALLQESSNVKSAPGVVPNGGKDSSKKSVAPGGVAFPQSRNAKAVPTIGKEGHKPGEKGNDRHSVAERAKFERRNTR